MDGERVLIKYPYITNVMPSRVPGDSLKFTAYMIAEHVFITPIDKIAEQNHSYNTIP